MALGELLGEERGQVIGVRVLPNDGGAPKIEATFQASGQLLGLESSDIATYVSTIRPDGTMYGEGQGLITTADGNVITWKGQGIGWSTGSGMAASYRGAVYYYTEAEHLARLNKVAGIYEYDVDEDGKTVAKLWEWS